MVVLFSVLSSVFDCRQRWRAGVIFGAAVLVCSVSASAQGVPLKFAPKKNVGTSIDLKTASETLLADYSMVKGEVANGPSKGISIADLRRIGEAAQGETPEILRMACRFFLESPVSRQLLSTPEERHRGLDTSIGRTSLQNLLSVIASNRLQGFILETTGDGRTKAVALRSVLRDPGIPDDLRKNMLGQLTDEKLLSIVGRPDMQGSLQDMSEESAAFLGLARLSWLGAAEAQMLASYKIPFRIDRGSSDKGTSFWDGKSMHISEKMAAHGAPGYISEVLAHEGGHAIFQASGLKAQIERDADRVHLTPGTVTIMNEGFAGVFGNRAHVALFGYGDRNIDTHLMLISDVDGSLASDNTYYAKRYHVDTTKARSQLKDIKKLLKQYFIPYFGLEFGLLGDPDLPVGLDQ